MMEVLRYKLGEKLSTDGQIIALGNFDGLHRGHQEIIKVARFIAHSKGLEASVLTFDPHPMNVLLRRPFKTILSVEHKLKLLEEYGIKSTILMEFDEELSHLRYNSFITQVLVNGLNCKHLVTGYNFHFGYKREGNRSILAKKSRQYGFNYTSINQISYNQQTVSTSEIKELLGLGAVGLVSRMLGRPYTISGIVSQGRKYASELGFPTANIRLDDKLCYPTNGVYLVRVMFDGKKLWGIANLGVRPTFDNTNKSLILEIHLLKFKGDLYNKDLVVELTQFLRPERKFSGPEALKAQVHTDIYNAKYVIKTVFNTKL